MGTSTVRYRRRLKAVHRTFRELKMIAKGLLSTDHPIQVHIIPMRRCNLACAYCNEYDDVSDPVPLEEMYRRIDKLAALGTTLITISGGETLLHPQLDDIIRRIRSHGIIAGLITSSLTMSLKNH
jgi:MoaA/NifB/PqqE/SkfB family radical SAM enzyme